MFKNNNRPSRSSSQSGTPSSGPRRSFTSSKGSGAFKRKGGGARASSFTPTTQGGGGFRGGRSSGGDRGARGGRKMPSFDPSQFINTNPVEIKEEVYIPKYTFASFGITETLVRNISSLGLSAPTPIQDQIIPHMLEGKDVIGLAQTGTGKTAAFLVPLIEKTLKDKNRQTLILAPTRELALQIESELRKLAFSFGFYSVVCVGGMNIAPQIRALKKHNHFIIGTPGRILDLIERKCFAPHFVTTVVLDEADRMLDMGFINDMRKILGTTQKSRETHLFSATMTPGASALVSEFLKNPITVSVRKKDVASSIEQDIVLYEHSAKFETLTALLSSTDFKRVLIFGSMKHSVEKLSEQLTKHGIHAESIHGNKSHNARQAALNKFKSGNARVLVATDVAARGIHVDGVTHVINYDLPNTFEDYVHRIGRTGRGTLRGKALTFVSNSPTSHGQTERKSSRPQHVRRRF